MTLDKIFTKIINLDSDLKFERITFGKAYAKLIKINAIIFKTNASKILISDSDLDLVNSTLINIKHNLKTLKPKAKVVMIYLKSREHNPELIIDDQIHLLFDPNL